MPSFLYLLYSKVLHDANASNFRYHHVLTCFLLSLNSFATLTTNQGSLNFQTEKNINQFAGQSQLMSLFTCNGECHFGVWQWQSYEDIVIYVSWILFPIWSKALKIYVLVYCMKKMVRFFPQCFNLKSYKRPVCQFNHSLYLAITLA